METLSDSVSGVDLNASSVLVEEELLTRCEG